MGYSFERKKGITITQAFQKILDELNLKPNKIWVYKGSEFHNRSLKSWLEKNGIEMHSTHNQGKSVIAERFIRTLKIKIYKFMLSVSQNAYIDKLDDIEHKWTYQRTIKMKPVNLKSNTYIDSRKSINDKNPKFKIGVNVKTSKYKNVFAKGYTLNWSGEVFVIRKVKNTVPWTYVIHNLNGKEIVETFCENEFQKTNQKEFRIEKVIKRKCDKLYVKWKGHNNLLNSWIDKKDIV